MSVPVVFDTITDSDGDAVAVITLGDLVVLRSIERDSGHMQEVFLDADLRDQFMHAWAEAERQAEAVPGA